MVVTLSIASTGDVVRYTENAKRWMKSMPGVSDFYAALKRFNGETFIHSEEVARLAVMFGQYKGYSEERLVDVAVSGFMHDIGKIFTGIDIIGKPETLEDREFRIVMEHPVVGYRHLMPFIESEDILLGVLQHHERIDGTGYPSRLRASTISEFGKIVSVADVFSAMTSVRPYKKAFSCDEALRCMIGSKEFDGDLLNILVDMYLKDQHCKGHYG